MIFLSIHCHYELGVIFINNNWIIDNLENALNTWNEKLSELWALITQSPETFKGGDIWNVIVNISSGFQGVGYGLLVLFFAMGVFQSAASFRELQRPEFALRHFIRFAGAKIAVGYAMDILLAIWDICSGIVTSVVTRMGNTVSATAAMPEELVSAMENVSFLDSIPLWLVSLLGSLIITVLSFILILTVYGRFFRLFMYTALAPLPLSTFAGEGTSANGKTFLKSYIGVCMEGAVIVLACLIYSAFLSSSAPVVGVELPVVTMVWQYIGEMVFNMLTLTGLIKGASRLAKEMFGL